MNKNIISSALLGLTINLATGCRPSDLDSALDSRAQGETLSPQVLGQEKLSPLTGEQAKNLQDSINWIKDNAAGIYGRLDDESAFADAPSQIPLMGTNTSISREAALRRVKALFWIANDSLDMNSESQLWNIGLTSGECEGHGMCVPIYALCDERLVGAFQPKDEPCTVTQASASNDILRDVLPYVPIFVESEYFDISNPDNPEYRDDNECVRVSRLFHDNMHRLGIAHPDGASHGDSDTDWTQLTRTDFIYKVQDKIYALCMAQ